MRIFFPVGGLGNRMRAIDSAVRCCESKRDNYIVLWPYDAKMMACKWHDLFVPCKYFYNVNLIYKLFIHLNKWRQSLSLLQGLLNFLERKHVLLTCWINDKERLKTVSESHEVYRLVIAETCEAFYFPQKSSFRTDLFCLTKELKKRVDEETNSFDSNTFGLHIRRTDNKDSVLHSPTELFKNVIREGIKTDARFYLCSDDELVKQELISDFGPGVIILPNCRGGMSRDTTEGIKQATVELFSLSQTTKIYGSWYSSFSQIASFIGNKPLEILKL